MSFWTVENGEIVGTNGDQRVPAISFCGMRRKLKTSIFLTGQANPFAGNGGIQFRSQRQPNGSAVGYQADIGKGWWGRSTMSMDGEFLEK